MQCLQRIPRSPRGLLLASFWGFLLLGCSAGGGQGETPPASTANDGVMRTANGQIIREAPVPSDDTIAGGEPAELSSSVGTTEQSAEALSGSDIALNRRDAGPEVVDVPEPPADDEDEEEGEDDEDEDD